MNKILLIGCGHMGSALLKAWSQEKKFSFKVVDPFNYNKINKNLNKKIKAFKNIHEVKNLLSSNIVIFAVKPQVAKEVLKEFLKYNFNNKTIFVSIIAGKKISFFNHFLPNKNQFIRVMPNMPALINQGISCLIASKNVTERNRNIINSLFLKVGKTFWLKKENDIDKVTAISGSGPGYIFLIVDAFEKAASELGLEKEVTRDLVYQTFLGSINLLLKDKHSAIDLANSIAISGGTTEAALKKFKDKNVLKKLFKKAVKAAYDRSVQLSK